ncbi:hypothetical protein [Chromatium okenii]|jgi:hypothetical protein|uniref:hypothetical protein n=1 Tax=Chromatium okenii TaxID=61644 RepID=UPI0026EC3246|nr:hypothetical protein [Chromatium okenii]MBV5309798.1 hypothetical protein [Chromatium okenii]
MLKRFMSLFMVTLAASFLQLVAMSTAVDAEIQKTYIYFAGDKVPDSNIPDEAPLCFRFKVVNLEEQLNKLTTKYSNLYDAKIIKNRDGTRSLLAKRKDDTDKEIIYFYSENPQACNERQRIKFSSADAQPKTLSSVDSNADGSDLNSGNEDVSEETSETPDQSPVSSQPELSKQNGAAPKADSEVVEIVAQGMGTDTDSALRNAYSNAIQQALGLYVDAETLVQNDQIVKDQLLTHSRGLIKKFTKISEGDDSGLHTVTIRAEVLRQPLIDQMKPILKTTVPLDGSNLHAALATKTEQVKDVQPLLDKAIKPFIGPAMFNFEIDGSPTFDEKKSELLVNVKITPNLKAYNQEREKLMQVLDQIAIGRETQIFESNKISGYGNGGVLYKYKPFSGKIANTVSAKISTVYVNTWKSKNRLQSKWEVYAVPANCSDFTDKAEAQIVVSILDENGELLAAKTSNTTPPNCNPLNMFYSGCYITPDISSNNEFTLYSSAVKEFSIPIDPSVLATMKSATVEMKFNPN